MQQPNPVPVHRDWLVRAFAIVLGLVAASPRYFALTG